MSLSRCILNLLNSSQNIDLSLNGFYGSGEVSIVFLNRLDSGKDLLQQIRLIRGLRNFSRSHCRMLFQRKGQG